MEHNNFQNREQILITIIFVLSFSVIIRTRYTFGMIAHCFDDQIGNVYVVHISEHATSLVAERIALSPVFFQWINNVDIIIIRELYRLVQPAASLVFWIYSEP